MKVRKDLSSTMRYLESPVYMENADRSRKIWIDDLVKALSNEQCRIRVAGMDDLEHSGYYSETISFFLLIGGLVFLVKIAYTEHLAYCSMKSEEEKERSQRKRKTTLSVSISEFIRYRQLVFLCVTALKIIVLHADRCAKIQSRLLFLIQSPGKANHSLQSHLHHHRRLLLRPNRSAGSARDAAPSPHDSPPQHPTMLGRDAPWHQGETLADAMWTSWTYVADPGAQLRSSLHRAKDMYHPARPEFSENPAPRHSPFPCAPTHERARTLGSKAART